MGNLLEQEGNGESEHGQESRNAHRKSSQSRSVSVTQAEEEEEGYQRQTPLEEEAANTFADEEKEIEKEEQSLQRSLGGENGNELDPSEDNHGRSSGRRTLQRSEVRQESGHISARSEDPLFEGEAEEEEKDEREEEKQNGQQNEEIERLREHERREAENLKFAEEFGGYTTHPTAQRRAVIVIGVSLLSAVIVTASTVYRLVVLDPICIEPDQDTVLRNTTEECGNDENPAMFIFLAFIQLLISLVIPFCGYYGSRHKQIDVLQAFRVASFAFGVYSLYLVIQASSSPSAVAGDFSECSQDDPCFSTYIGLQAVTGICYLTLNIYLAGKLVEKLLELESDTENAETRSPFANLVRTAGLVAIFEHRDIREEDYVHPAATPVPLVDEEFLRQSKSKSRQKSLFGFVSV